MNYYDKVEDIIYGSHNRPKQEIVIKSKKHEYTNPRHETWYVLNNICGLSFAEIGRHYIRNHSIIRNGVYRVRDERQTDRIYGLRIQGLMNECSHVLFGSTLLREAKFAFRKEVNAVVHICPLCDNYVFSLQTKKQTHCSECGVKIKLEL